MEMISVLSFKVWPLKFPWGTTTTIVPVLDDRDLIDWITEYERWHDFRLPGAYAGLIPGDSDAGPKADYLMWDTMHGIPCERYVLGCNCGCAGCWPLCASICRWERFVIWDQFRHPRLPDQDYSAFGPFVFDRNQYASAVREVITKTRHP